VDGMGYRLELAVGDVRTVWTKWLEPALGDVWKLWTIGWN